MYMYFYMVYGELCSSGSRSYSPWLTTSAHCVQSVQTVVYMYMYVRTYTYTLYVCVLFHLVVHREPLPGTWGDRLDDFQRLLVLKCVRPDRLTDAMQNYVSVHLGQRFIEPQTAELGLVFKDSSTTTPLIFVLSPVGASLYMHVYT